MDDLRLGTVEAKFADLIWRSEPLTSRQLVALCEKELEWKKSTTYTVLKRLCDRGIFQNQNGVVSSLLTRDAYFSLQSQQFVDNSFGGSLPAFLAAFTSRKRLSDAEITEIRQMIDSMGR